MKASKCPLLIALIPLLGLLSACSSSSGNSNGTIIGTNPDNTTVQSDPTYPDGRDSHEGSEGDNTPATASTITIGTPQRRTIWPIGDIDYVKVDLTAGTSYEFSANDLCVPCDTYMYLYGPDGSTELASNDDYIGLDSRIVYTPEVDGTYFIKIEAYKDNNLVTENQEVKADYGVNIYTLSVHVFTDNDGDGYSAYYDCNDGNDSIFPKAAEITGDGISQNCSGVDQLIATTPDTFEPDNDPGAAKPMFMTAIGLWEIQLQQSAWAQNARTIHAEGDKDYFTFTLAPQEGAYLDMHRGGWPATLLLTLYDSDGTTVLGTSSGDWPSHWVANSTTANKTFYVSYETVAVSAPVDGGAPLDGNPPVEGDVPAEGEPPVDGDAPPADGEPVVAVMTTWYVPALYSAGVDKDGDGYYSRDWGNVRDCNDSNANIYPGAIEVLGDGIDSNCNGKDE